MSAERWFIPGPNGRKETTNFQEVQDFLRAKAEEKKLLLTGKKTPTPPKFVPPARRAPSMRVSLR